MATGRRKSERSTRQKMSSPGRPPVWQRENLCRFWREVAAGLSSEDAAVESGVSGPVGNRWFRSSGGMPPTHLSPSATPLKSRGLTFREREDIALECARGSGIRAIARKLGRSPSTISREIRRNSATRAGDFDYRAITAQWHADRAARRPKVAKLELILSFVITYRTGSRASLPRPKASPLMGQSWYGKDGGPFIGKVDAGPKPGARNRLRGV